MPRRIRFLGSVLVAFAGVSVVAGASFEDDASAYSVEELIAALTDKLTSIGSIYCEYTVQYGDSVGPIQCRYARSGAKWHYTELSVKDGRVKENTFCFDEQLVYGYVVRHAEDAPGHWSTVQLQDPRDQENLDPECLLGAKLSNVSRSIVDALSIGRVTMSREPFGNGTAAIRLVALGVPSASARSANLKYDVAVTLDATHDLLPREILITESEENVTWPGWAHHWKVLEYRRVLDARTNEERWFPASGVLTQGATGAPAIRLTLIDVQLNPALAATLFRPDIPDGTQVADTTSDGRGQRFIKGGSYAVVERMDRLTDTSTRALGWSVNRWLFISFNAAVVCVLILVILARTFRRRSTSERPTMNSQEGK